MSYYVSLTVTATGDSSQLNALCQRMNKAQTIDDIIEKKDCTPTNIPTQIECDQKPEKGMKKISFTMHSKGFSLRNTLFESLTKRYPALNFRWKEFDEMALYESPDDYAIEEGEILQVK